MKKKIWRKLTAVAVAAAMITSMPVSVLASDLFSSGEEYPSANSEENFESGVDEAAENLIDDRSENMEETEVSFSGQESGTEPGTAEIYGAEDQRAYVPYISTLSLPHGKVGDYYSARLEGSSRTGNSLRWRLGRGDTLPEGLTLTQDGAITGVPRTEGDNSFYVIAADGEAESERRLELTIEKADPWLTYDMEIEAQEGLVDLGYALPGEYVSKTLLITNCGKEAVHISELPQCEYFQFDPINDQGVEIGRNGRLRLFVKSKEGLPGGTYEEKITLVSYEGARCEFTLKATIGSRSEADYHLTVVPETVVVDEYVFSEDNELYGETFVRIANTGKMDTKVTRDTSMLENYFVSDHTAEIDDEEAEDVHRILKPGDSILLCITPKHEYGSYQEEFYVCTDDGSRFAVPIVQNITKPDKPQNYIEISPSSVTFDSAYAYYITAPQEQTLTVKNISTNTVKLSQLSSRDLDIGSIDKTSLAPGETAQFTVQPASGLEVGSHMWWVNVRAETEEGKSSLAYAEARFTVSSYNFESALPIEPVGGITNGAEKSPVGLKLPETLRVNGAGEAQFDVAVEWDTEECSYDPSLKEEQNFTVKGHLQIPKEQNNKDLDTTVEISVQVKAYDPLGQPQIETAKVTGNYLDVTLYDRVNDAEGYQFVLTAKESDLEKNSFVKSVNSTSTSAVIQYIQKGSYFLYCRPYRKEEGKNVYGLWSQSTPVTVTVKTAKAPSITKTEVKNCDVRLTIKTPEKVGGFDAVLARKKTGNTPSDYAVKTINCSGDSKTIVLKGAAKGTYYVGIHSYIYQQNRKVFSPWSKLIKVTVKNGIINTAPVIKNTSIKGRNVTVNVSRPKGTTGADWVFVKTVSTDADGNYTGFTMDYSYIMKNQTGTKIIFKNVKPGTYYVTGHAYLKGYTKNFTKWSDIKKIVVK
ncbi:MAG: hypothetical protein Q4D16_06955 [Eubacteriales bacterium]|nr:hypothetical protein [Eubacteriales bacterium]